MKYNNSSLNFFMEWKLIKKSVLDIQFYYWPKTLIWYWVEQWKVTKINKKID